jgi:hypothetical protein
VSCSTPTGVTPTGGAVTARHPRGGHQKLIRTLRHIQQHPSDRRDATVPAWDGVPSS